jgi:uncharacterized membrane protein YsdA (DUF1294 family)
MDIIQIILLIVCFALIVVPPTLIFVLYWLDRKTARFVLSMTAAKMKYNIDAVGATNRWQDRSIQ